MDLTIYLTNLEQIAHRMEVRVRYASPPGSMWGVYDRKHHLITLRPGMGQAQLVSTFAHELGHAHYGHHGHHPKTERLADKWAARRLLTLDLIKEHSVDSMETPALAASLGVLPEVVRTFIATLSFAQGVELMNHTAEIHA